MRRIIIVLALPLTRQMRGVVRGNWKERTHSNKTLFVSATVLRGKITAQMSRKLIVTSACYSLDGGGGVVEAVERELRS